MKHIYKRYFKLIIGSGIFLGGIATIYIVSAILSYTEFRLDDQIISQFGSGISTYRADIDFKYGGNKKTGIYFPRSLEILSIPEEVTLNGSNTGYCYAKVRGLYYNNQRGERLRPLDTNTLTGLRAINSSYNNLQLSGGLFTMCSGSNYLSGNVYGQITMIYGGTTYYLIGGTDYNFTLNIHGTNLSGSLERKNNSLIGYVWDNYGGIGNIGIDTTPPTISGITDGGIYTTSVTFTVTDNVEVLAVRVNKGELYTWQWTNYTLTTVGLYQITARDTSDNITIINFEIKKESSGGGGGGSSMTKDNCPNGDYSSSYYDKKCGEKSLSKTGFTFTGHTYTSTGKNSIIDLIKSFIPQVIQNIEIPTKQEIIDAIRVAVSSKTKDELAEAYKFAVENNITSIENIEDVEFTGVLTRIQMAKMVSNYAINVMGKNGTIENADKCYFEDLKSVDSSLSPYATISCQLGLMGMDSNGGIKKNFNPYGEVTRAQFGTILSRLLRGDRYNKSGANYYEDHLKALNEEGIVNYISGNPSDRKELRGRAMIMLKRASE